MWRYRIILLQTEHVTEEEMTFNFVVSAVMFQQSLKSITFTEGNCSQTGCRVPQFADLSQR
jgi:hypothetical protein